MYVLFCRYTTIKAVAHYFVQYPFRFWISEEYIIRHKYAQNMPHTIKHFPEGNLDLLEAYHSALWPYVWDNQRIKSRSLCHTQKKWPFRESALEYNKEKNPFRPTEEGPWVARFMTQDKYAIFASDTIVLRVDKCVTVEVTAIKILNGIFAVSFNGGNVCM